MQFRLLGTRHQEVTPFLLATALYGFLRVYQVERGMGMLKLLRYVTHIDYLLISLKKI